MRALLLFLILSPIVSAQTTYTAIVPEGERRQWNDMTTWSPQGIPLSDDTVIINGEVEMANSVTVARLFMRNGSLLGDGTITVTDSVAWTGGRLDARGFRDGAALFIPQGSVLAIRDGEDKDLRGRDILVDGRMDWAGIDSLWVWWDTEIHIRPGATWDITSTGAITHNNGRIFTTIDGTLRRFGDGATDIEYESGDFTVNGELRVDGGTLRLTSGPFLTSGGSGNIHIDVGQLEIAGGTYDFSNMHLTGRGGQSKVLATGGRFILGTADFPGVIEVWGGEVDCGAAPEATRLEYVTLYHGTFGARLQGPGATITNDFVWFGGELSKFGTLIIEPDSEFGVYSAMGGGGSQTFAGGIIRNHGRMLFSAPEVGVSFTHEIYNEASGEIVIETGEGWTLNRAQGFVRLVNDGTFVVRGTPGTARWETEFGSFWNRGEVRVESGRFVVEGSPPGPVNADTGRWVTLNGTEVEFTGRRYMTPEASIEGEGTADFGPLLEFSEMNPTLAPGLSGLGGLSLVGAFPLVGASGVLDVELGTGGMSDRVTTPDPADLEGTLRVRLLPGVVPIVGDRYRIISSPLGANGAFDALDLPSGLTGMVETDAAGAEFVVTAFVPNEAEPLVPEALALAAPSPNPARRAVALAYSVGERGPVRLALVDMLGREVAVVASGEHAAGEHIATLDASGLSPGIYAAVLTAAGAQSVQTLTITR